MSIALGERSTELKELIEKQKNDMLMHQLNVDALIKEKTKALEKVRSELNQELNETRRKSSAAEAAAAARGKTPGRGGSEGREREREGYIERELVLHLTPFQTRSAATALHDVERLQTQMKEKEEEIKAMQSKLLENATRFDELPEQRRRRSSVAQR